MVELRPRLRHLNTKTNSKHEANNQTYCCGLENAKRRDLVLRGDYTLIGLTCRDRYHTENNCFYLESYHQVLKEEF